MSATQRPDRSPARTYARFLRQLHALIAEGKGDSSEAEALSEQMDDSAKELTAEERDRLSGLSEDFYALAEGAGQPVALSPPEIRRWDEQFRQASEAGDWDRLLRFLRHAPREALTLDAVRSLQAECWERLGDRETALVFMQEAARLNPQHALSVERLLGRLGRVADTARQCGG
jgi:hypothetical protein